MRYEKLKTRIAEYKKIVNIEDIIAKIREDFNDARKDREELIDLMFICDHLHWNTEGELAEFYNNYKNAIKMYL